MKNLQRAGLTTLIGAVLALGSLSAHAQSADVSKYFKPDDGTYKTVTVTSNADCTLACKAESKCRGSVTFQPDISKPEMLCRLNDGFGTNPLFPQTPPEPLDKTVAVAELNSYRAQHGLGAVTLNEKLSLASAVHAADLSKAGIISHTGTDGSSHGDRVQRQGYYFTVAGENVATGQKSWPKVFQAWKDSPGHNENLLRDDVTEFGIALVYEPTTTYSTYWAMIVANPIPEGQEHRYRMITNKAPS